MGRKTLSPDARGVLQAISRIGYQIQEALADLIDNSIDAGAKSVLIRFFRDGGQLTDVVVVDDGSGMDEETLEEAMRFGSRTKKRAQDLGKYGMGMKSASLNHAQTLVVMTRQSGLATGRRWTTESIQDGWRLERLDPAGAEAFLDRDWGPLTTNPSGTAVLWERIPRFRSAGGDAGRRFAAISKEVTKHLGLVFHRFLSNDRLRVYLDLQDLAGDAGLRRTVQPLEPFPKTSGLTGYPAGFRTKLGTYGSLTFIGHIWPPKSPDPGYKLGGKVAQRQGFYFYRNDRLIQAGGWNGWRDDAEPHASLARVEVNLPPRFDDAFAISVQKSGVDAPPGFLDAIEAAKAGRTTMADYIRDAVDLYRSAESPSARTVATVTKGLRRPLRKKLEATVREEAESVVGVDIRWVSYLGAQEVFRVEPGQRTIVINESFRARVLGGASASAGDAPIFKTLLFALVGEDALKERMSKKLAARHRALNAFLLAAIDDAA